MFKYFYARISNKKKYQNFLFQIITIATLCTWIKIVQTKEVTSITDQIGIASEVFTESSVKTEDSLHGHHTNDAHENADKFVPITDCQEAVTSHPKNTLSAMKNEIDERNSRNLNVATNDLDANSISSPGVRFLLTIPNTESNRRSFDTHQNQRAFEILKVTNETPTIANYHEFYNNLKNNLNIKNYDNPVFNQDTISSQKKERMRIINEYFNAQARPSATQGENSYWYKNQIRPSQLNDALAKTSIFEPEKVKHNSQQDEDRNQNKFYHRDVVPRTKSNIYSSSNYEQNMSEDRYDKKEDYSDENSDYSESTEVPPRRSQKHKRRHHHHHQGSSSKRLPKEHRDGSDSGELKKLNTHGRTKSRDRTKSIDWSEEYHNSFGDDVSNENISNNKQQISKNRKKPLSSQNSMNQEQTWNQISPNIEFSKAHGLEVSQIDNPNLLVPNFMNLNLMPMSNQNTHGSNFPLHNNGFSNSVVGTTMSPIMSTTPSMILQNVSPQNLLDNSRYNNLVPDIIVGQNTYQQPVHTVLLPQFNMNNEYTSNIRTPYLTSTMAPIFTISQPFTPSMHNVQSTAIPKTSADKNQNGPQIFLPQASPTTTSYNYLMNSGSHQTNLGQNNQLPKLVNFYKPMSGNQGAKNSVLNTKIRSYGNENNSNNDDRNSENYNDNRNSENENDHRDVTYDENGNDNKYTLSSTNMNHNNFHLNMNNQQFPRSQLQTSIYPIMGGSQFVPTVIQNNDHINPINQNNGNLFNPQLSISHSPSIVHIPKKFNQLQLMNIANNFHDNIRHQQTQINDAYNNRGRYQNSYTYDNVGSTSNQNSNAADNGKIYSPLVEQAQLPVIGMDNVEIKNAGMDIKPSPLDLTLTNGIDNINSYPTTILTTPIPILSTTTGFITSGPIMTSTPSAGFNTMSNYINSLGQVGFNNNQQFRQLDSTTKQQSTFNPMNFIPNWDIINSQKLLNSKGHMPKPLAQHLELASALPGGNFDKHSPQAQMELVKKPKLSSDLEKYAEEMFKESLRTIFNSHRWNSDKKSRNLTESDIAELEKLKSDFSRLKAAMMAHNNGKEILEAHHSETKFRTAQPGKKIKTNEAALKELLKSDFDGDGHTDYHRFPSNGRINRPRVKDRNRINDYLTPPKINSLIAKGTHMDNNDRKRPIGRGPRFENIKSRPKTNHRQSPIDIPISSQTMNTHQRQYYDEINNDYQSSQHFDHYTTFSTPSSRSEAQDGHASYDEFHDNIPTSLDFNLPKTHNLLGLLMKNKQLPKGVN
uniref:Uncharacterized protein n=1 Tax=Bracon brevicornis TaxID=1563983 RepID=A0A6V7JIN4_9HYME